MLQEPTNRTEVSELGEFGLIKLITENYKIRRDDTLCAMGDDAAVIDAGARAQVVTTDMLVEGVHFDLMYTPLKHLGYKAVTCNLSDVAAMNAIPSQVLVSIALSNRFSVEAVEELYKGIYLACEKYGVDLVGGDTTSSTSGIVISVTAMGWVDKENVVYRSGAKVNDLLCVSGDLGGAYMGLQLLEREKNVFQSNPNIQPDLAGNDYVLERQLKPEARVDVVRKWADLGLKPSAAIDISDGLSSEVLHLCTSSNVGCQLYEEKIPIDPSTASLATSFNLDPSVCALSGGEDYELLFTIAQADFDKVRNHPDFTVIGHITDAGDGVNLVARDETVHPVTAQGWDALLKKDQGE
ncbi:MAG: thiamine-phosphate kinase [Flavobacteriales bacterium]|nr:thiamine-phosphate kinase [Flavobacteriales bacterium]